MITFFAAVASAVIVPFTGRETEVDMTAQGMARPAAVLLGAAEMHLGGLSPGVTR